MSRSLFHVLTVHGLFLWLCSCSLSLSPDVGNNCNIGICLLWYLLFFDLTIASLSLSLKMRKSPSRLYFLRFLWPCFVSSWSWFSQATQKIEKGREVCVLFVIILLRLSFRSTDASVDAVEQHLILMDLPSWSLSSSCFFSWLHLIPKSLCLLLPLLTVTPLTCSLYDSLFFFRKRSLTFFWSSKEILFFSWPFEERSQGKERVSNLNWRRRIKTFSAYRKSKEGKIILNLLSSRHTSCRLFWLSFFSLMMSSLLLLSFLQCWNSLNTLLWLLYKKMEVFERVSVSREGNGRVKFQIEFHIHFMQDLSDDLPQTSSDFFYDWKRRESWRKSFHWNE